MSYSSFGAFEEGYEQDYSSYPMNDFSGYYAEDALEEDVFRSCGVPEVSITTRETPVSHCGFSFDYDWSEKSAPVAFSVCNEAPQLPPSPYMLDSTHYFSSRPLPELIMEVESSLKAKGVDLTFNQIKLKFKASLLVSGNLVQFRVRIFRVDTRHVVEFQRRSGGSMLWLNLYREITVSSSGANFMRPRRVPMCLASEETRELSSVDLLPLIDMAKSPFIEHQIEGARTLAALSGETSTACMLLQSQALSCQDMSNLLRSKSVEVVAAAALLVSNLTECSHESSSPITLQQVIPALLATVDAYQTTQLATQGSGNVFALVACLGAVARIVSLTQEAASAVAAAGGEQVLTRCISGGDVPMYSKDTEVTAESKEAGGAGGSALVDASRALATLRQRGLCC